MPDHFTMVTVDASVVMPDHVHAILVISSETEPERVPAKRPFETLPMVVGSFKSAVSRLVRQTAIPSFQWQKSYHDHIVRDDGELERIRAYITANPRRWWETHGQDMGDRS
jgi:REP element-mobilizing transposase RayT